MTLCVINDMPRGHGPPRAWGPLLLLFIDVQLSSVCSNPLGSRVGIDNARRKEGRGTVR